MKKALCWMWVAALVATVAVGEARAGLNAGATARLYWQVETGTGLTDRNSTASTAQLVVTLTGVKSFRGADVCRRLM